MFSLGDRVEIRQHRYVGLTGRIIWASDDRTLLQIETDTKPPYYRPANPPYIVTVEADQLDLLEKTTKVFTLERTSKKLKFDINRASKQGLWFSIYKMDYSKCSDFYMTNEEAINLLRKLNRDLNVFEDTL